MRIVIDVLDIDLDERGYILAKPDFGVLRDFIERPVARMCSVADGHVEVCGIRLPVRPMIGVLATAPSGEPRGTAYVGSYGGNMDCNLIAVGSPRAAAGSGRRRLALRRRRARDDGRRRGQRLGSRVRRAGDVAARPREGARALKWPTVETADTFACIASAPEFYDAAEIAVRNMVDCWRRSSAWRRSTPTCWSARAAIFA